MKNTFVPRARHAVLTLALFAAGFACHAQTANRSVQAVAPRPAPAAVTTLPNPAGLPSVQPSPGGLTSQFPAGLPSNQPNPAGLPDVTSPGTVAVTPATPAAQVPAAAPAAGGAGVAATGQFVPGGPGPYTALQLAQSFLAADANRDGELSRAEAQRLSIMPVSFEEMDRNKDGVVTRSEYEDSVR